MNIPTRIRTWTNFLEESDASITPWEQLLGLLRLELRTNELCLPLRFSSPIVCGLDYAFTIDFRL